MVRIQKNYDYRQDCYKLLQNLEELNRKWLPKAEHVRDVVDEMSLSISRILITEILRHTGTPELLNWLNHARAGGGYYSPFETNESFSLEEIKAELDTREHVPNKKERKENRRRAAEKKKANRRS